MKNVMLNRITAAIAATAVAMSMITALPLHSSATAAEPVTVYPTADIQFRKNNSNDLGTTKGIEVRNDATVGPNGFLGGLQFDLSAVNTEYLKSATLEFVTETRDKDIPLYVKPFSDNWSESSGNKYSDKQTIIDDALAADKVAEFKVAYGGKKIFEATGVADENRVLSKWTSKVNVTEYVMEQLNSSDTTISMLITPGDTSEAQGVGFLSKDASAANYGNADRWNAILTAFSGEISSDNLNPLKPRLVLEYNDPDAMPRVTTVTVSGSSQVNSYTTGTADVTSAYTAQVLDQNDEEMLGQTVTWESTTTATANGAFIDADTGVLIMPANAPAQTVTITATCGSVSSAAFTVEIICEKPEAPKTVEMSKGVRIRGNGNTLYESPITGNEIGMYTAHAVAILQYDLTNVIASSELLAKLTLYMENADVGFTRPIGAWLYEAPAGDTRTDGKTWKNTDWSSPSNKNDVWNNLSLVLGSSDYGVKDGDGAAAGRSGYTSPIATAAASDGKYALELSGESLVKAVEYAKNHNNILELVLTSSTADPTAENRARIYFVDDGSHKKPYFDVTYGQPASIAIEGTKSIDLTGAALPMNLSYTAKVLDQQGNELPAPVTWSYATTATNGAVSFDAAAGTLTIPANATEQTVTITASCGGISENIQVLIARLVPTYLEIVGADSINNYVATSERTFVYTVKVLDQNHQEIAGSYTPAWTFSTDATENAATFANGVITAPIGVADQTITLTATVNGITQTKTIVVKKTILDMPESFAAVTSMKLRGMGNTSPMVINPETEEICMKAGAPAIFRFDLSGIINDASDVITSLSLSVYKSSGTSIAMGLWNYADPNDTQRTDGRTWIDTDWTDTANKADVLNNYSLIFGMGDMSAKSETGGKDWAQGRSSYIAPMATANVDGTKYMFQLEGEALKSVLSSARKNGGMVDLVVTSSDLDARSQQCYLYMSGVTEKNAQYMPTLGVTYDLPSTPRKIEIAGNDTLYINPRVASYHSSYTAKVYDQFGALYGDQTVTWSADFGTVQNISFDDQTGTLTINSNTTAGDIKIKATSAYATEEKTIHLTLLPESFRNGSFEDTDDSYLADGWTANVPYYKINFDDGDTYYPWNESSSNDGGTLFARTQGYAAKEDTGEIRGSSGVDSVLRLAYSTGLSDEDAENLMNSATQMLGINNAKPEGFFKIGFDIPYYYMLDYYLTADAQQIIANQGLYMGMEFRNKADTAYLGSVATGDKVMPYVRGRWQTYVDTFTSGTDAQINGQARVNIGIRGMRGTAYVDYFRLIPKGVDQQVPAYDGTNSMQVANGLTWTSDVFSVEEGSYYTYYASARPENQTVTGQITYTFMDNNYEVVGETVLDTETGEWSQADENGWQRIEGQIVIPAGAMLCKITLSNPEKNGNIWFDGLVFTKTEEAKAATIRITGGNAQAIIPDTGSTSYQYTAVVYDQYNHVMSSDVTWSVAKEDGSAAQGVSITAGGVMNVSASAAEGKVVVTVAKDGKSASKTVELVQRGQAGEPEATGPSGLNGSFTDYDKVSGAPLGWTNDGREVVRYTFDSGMESWKNFTTNYGAPLDGDLLWDEAVNYTADKAKSGSLKMYNPSFNLQGARIPNDVAIQGGMRYRFELMFRQEDVTDDSAVRFYLRYFNSEGNTIADTANLMYYSETEYNREKDENGWQKWAIDCVAPLNAATARIEMRYRGGLNNENGTVWLDDIGICKITRMDDAHTYNGNPTLMLVGYNEDASSFGRGYGERWLSDPIVNIVQGNTYEYSAVMQTYAAESGAYLSFVFYDASGTEIGTKNSEKVTGTTNGWTQLSGSVVAPRDAASVAIAYNINGTGKAWLSGVSFDLMRNTDVSGIRINGASTIKVPSSGSKSETYTVDCVNSAGNAVGAADAKITASSLPKGVSLTNRILSVENGANTGTVTLKAEYNGFTATKTVSITANSNSDSSGGSSGGSGGGSGGGGGSSGGGTGGGTTSSGSQSGSKVNTSFSMGYVDYNKDNTTAVTDKNEQSTDTVPTLLQAPELNYFTGGDKAQIFDDLGDAAWAKQAIEALYKAGIINGKAEKKFAPNDNVTRAEFVKMLVGTFQLKAENADGVSFTDVNDSDWYADAVKTAAALGIVNGQSADYFGASEQISRQDICVMAARLWTYLEKEMSVAQTAAFTDEAAIAGYAHDAVMTMAAAGIVNGMDTGAFEPIQNATRAQAAVIIYRLAVKYDA